MEEIKDAVVGGVKGILATMPVGSVVMSIKYRTVFYKEDLRIGKKRLMRNLAI